MTNKIYLVLENGMVFEGESFGAQTEVKGEVVFTTAMTGYNEAVTDPSFCGQIVVQTFPLVGDYGIVSSDFESNKTYVKGYVVREWCQSPSNFRCEGDIDTFFESEGIVGISGIDTRELTKIIRDAGTMNGIITSDPENVDFDELRAFRSSNLVEEVSTKEEYSVKPDGKAEYNVVLLDLGTKKSIIDELVKRGCEVTVVPHNTKAERIKEINPDGFILSSGPGDPEDNQKIIAELKNICDLKIPTFGICLGHMLLALSQGGKARKLKYGHRGANQPAQNVDTGRIYITSQGHGYEVVTESMPDYMKVSYINVNDKTCEGIRYENIPAFTVQFHPEAAAGPLDTNFIFDEFIALMKEEN